MSRKRTSRMEFAAVQPSPAEPDPRDAEIERLRARVAELEAGPQTLAEVAALVEAACTERDQLRRRLAAEIATTDMLRAEIGKLGGNG